MLQWRGAQHTRMRTWVLVPSTQLESWIWQCMPVILALSRQCLPRAHWPASPAEPVSCRFGEWLSKKNYSREWYRKTPDIGHWPSHAPAYKCICTNTHLCMNTNILHTCTHTWTHTCMQNKFPLYHNTWRQLWGDSYWHSKCEEWWFPVLELSSWPAPEHTKAHLLNCNCSNPPFSIMGKW